MFNFGFLMVPKNYLKLIIVSLFLNSCILESSDNLTDDEFYTATRIADLDRIPLIKPYELVSPTSDSWFLKYPIGEEHISISEIENVLMMGIKDSIILLYSPSTYFPGGNSEAFYCINTVLKTTEIYKSREEFMKKPFNITIEILSVRNTFRLFKDKNILPWKIKNN